MGIDLGTRRTGIALSDPSATLATPLETVTLTGDDLRAHLRTLITRHRVVRVVIGLAAAPAGGASEMAVRARRLAADLEGAAGVEVILWDEVLTSWEAESILRGDRHVDGGPGDRRAPRGARARRRRSAARRGGSAQAARRQREAGEVDRLAATLILQDYLDARRSETRDGRTGET